MPVNTAKSLLAKYWKGGLPISPSKLAAAEGLTVEPFADHQHRNLSGEVDGKVIRYNPTDSGKRQRFTVAHELGHYMLGHGHAFRDPSAHFSMSYYDPREVAANKFAAEILMPELAVKVLIKQRKITDIKELARIFDVSINAMSYRLQSLGFL
ncbi:ImmA/IrrE family metallo-endopeptidase [Pluralibacter gergoviae]|uniref:ImmA/IrrE family metallo-endopeptidase n=1 Tax=Pluralibacter gergoviae TaxID=61647 RepID=UPI0007DABE18|nr:ImmA/IrrE family metallo-endopeptidase [Pluralibacter gergoviae]EKV0932295.1 ImmA/IrrE family metallo-endopeptidase [Pluralibacter gergoviae]ELD4273615.1 ImmA/IrrE family metallo-endopeptidase [Pluralibacter gergoviae]ELD4279226.1 ImmA/IrrE family metallo-endopeptidase [Pluralibacter gergoviae]ELD4280396.1 ImmA/IrrE family metallo-endopeptidase [Pluralibacter gergoviae]ELD4318698.1 ImmA/IrrE family metallo-endopeptidase [Pluralibacter gergoviae]